MRHIVEDLIQKFRKDRFEVDFYKNLLGFSLNLIDKIFFLRLESLYNDSLGKVYKYLSKLITKSNTAFYQTIQSS
jgi:hypothetical protein